MVEYEGEESEELDVLSISTEDVVDSGGWRNLDSFDDADRSGCREETISAWRKTVPVPPSTRVQRAFSANLSADNSYWLDKWENHRSQLERSEQCDLLVRAADGQIMAHSTVLAISSTFLKGLLADGCACGRDEKVLVLPFLSLQETKSILSIFYTGSAEVSSSALKKTKAGLRLLGVTNIQTNLVKRELQTITPKNSSTPRSRSNTVVEPASKRARLSPPTVIEFGSKSIGQMKSQEGDGHLDDGSAASPRTPQTAPTPNEQQDSADIFKNPLSTTPIRPRPEALDTPARSSSVLPRIIDAHSSEQVVEPPVRPASAFTPVISGHHTQGLYPSYPGYPGYYPYPQYPPYFPHYLHGLYAQGAAGGYGQQVKDLDGSMAGPAVFSPRLVNQGLISQQPEAPVDQISPEGEDLHQPGRTGPNRPHQLGPEGQVHRPSPERLGQHQHDPEGVGNQAKENQNVTWTNSGDNHAQEMPEENPDHTQQLNRSPQANLLQQQFNLANLPDHENLDRVPIVLETQEGEDSATGGVDYQRAHQEGAGAKPLPAKPVSLGGQQRRSNINRNRASVNVKNNNPENEKTETMLDIRDEITNMDMGGHQTHGRQNAGGRFENFDLLEDVPLAQRTRSDDLRCEYCRMELANKYKLRLHTFYRHTYKLVADFFPDNQRTCPICKRNDFRSKASFLKHYGLKHEEATTKDNFQPDVAVREAGGRGVVAEAHDEIHHQTLSDLPTNVADEDDLDSLLNSETDITKDTDDTSGDMWDEPDSFTCCGAKMEVTAFLTHCVRHHARKQIQHDLSKQFKDMSGVCAECDNEFKDFWLYCDHVGVHHRRVVPYLINDNTMLMHRSVLKNLMPNPQTQRRLMSCPLCGKEEYTRGLMVKHIVDVHYYTQLREYLEPDFREGKSCDCKVDLSTFRYYIRHFATKHMLINLFCPPEISEFFQKLNNNARGSMVSTRETCAVNIPVGLEREKCSVKEPVGFARETCAVKEPVGFARETCAVKEPVGLARETCAVKPIVLAQEADALVSVQTPDRKVQLQQNEGASRVADRGRGKAMSVPLSIFYGSGKALKKGRMSAHSSMTKSSPKTPVLREKVKGVRRSVLKTVHTGEKGHQGLKVKDDKSGDNSPSGYKQKLKRSSSVLGEKSSRARQYRCQLCNLTNPGYKRFLNHLSNGHYRQQLRKEFNIPPMSKDKEFLFKCPKCNEKISCTNFYSHIGSKHEEVKKYYKWFNLENGESRQDVNVAARQTELQNEDKDKVKDKVNTNDRTFESCAQN